jgi:hypothetical protein
MGCEAWGTEYKSARSIIQQGANEGLVIIPGEFEATSGSIIRTDFSVKWSWRENLQYSLSLRESDWLVHSLFRGLYIGRALFLASGSVSLFQGRASPVAALMMAVFLATSFPGNYIAGWLGEFYSPIIPTQFFLMIEAIAAAPAAIIWAFDRPLLKLLKRHEDARQALAPRLVWEIGQRWTLEKSSIEEVVFSTPSKEPMAPISMSSFPTSSAFAKAIRSCSPLTL